ncbi:DUF342 domain-containing protein [Candidatus Woesearchaeota archaeon]|nr:DUF342 domain-containing protein [Candidatus Woesearchaeota archaeon]
MKKTFVILLILSLFLVSASALEIFEDEEVLIEDDINESVYFAGGQVTSDGAVNGDITGFGGSVVINSFVEEDLVVFGGDISINGDVKDHAHVCGGNININGLIGGDLMTGGGNINVNGVVKGDVKAGGANININDVLGDVLVLAGNVNVNGDVGGDVALTAGEAKINGVVEGDVVVEADTFKLGKNAVIKGNLDYTASKVEFEESQVLGNITKGTVIEKEHVISPIFLKTSFLTISALAYLLIGLILVVLMPKLSEDLSEDVNENPIKAGLLGILVLFGVPVLSLMLFLTLIGIPIALMVILIYVVTLFLAQFIPVLYVGKQIYNKPEALAVPMLIGIALYWVILRIPILGGITKFLAIIIGLGVIANHIFSRRARKSTAWKKIKRR